MPQDQVPDLNQDLDQDLDLELELDHLDLDPVQDLDQDQDLVQRTDPDFWDIGTACFRIRFIEDS